MPPGGVATRESVPPAHTTLPPEMAAPPDVMTIFLPDIQPVGAVYITCAGPAISGVSTPDALIVAKADILTDHVPPGVALVYVAVVPRHTVSGPSTGCGVGFTVIVFVAKQPPTVYVIVVVPALTPVMMPDVNPIVAIDGLLLIHVPPAGKPRYVVDPTSHIMLLPEMRAVVVVTVTVLTA